MSSLRQAAGRRFRGMMQIVRFNPAFYSGAILALGLAVAGEAILRSHLPRWLAELGWAGAGLGAWWVLGSLIASHWVYDLSGWPQGGWLRHLLKGQQPCQVLNVHAGFDETTERLRQWYPSARVESLDLFEPDTVTEGSLLRARAARPPLSDALQGTYAHWPEAASRKDLICFLLTAHEFRTHGERCALLKSAARALSDASQACIVLAEHARDGANFLAFGPGFVHFHSVNTWKRAWEEAGLRPTQAFRVTPFLRVWCLQRKEAA